MPGKWCHHRHQALKHRSVGLDLSQGLVTQGFSKCLVTLAESQCPQALLLLGKVPLWVVVPGLGRLQLDVLELVLSALAVFTLFP